MVLSFWFKRSRGGGTKAVQGSRKIRGSNSEWRILEAKGLGHEGARKITKRKLCGDKLSPPRLGRRQLVARQISTPVPS
jgi:hypothetical protein